MILFRSWQRILPGWALDYLYAGRVLGSRKFPTRFSHLGAYNTEQTPYAVLKFLFKQIEIAPDDVIVDVGCGWGRVLYFLLSRGITNPMLGLELDPQVAAITRERLAPHPNVRIITGDATANLPAEGTLFFLYNPFAEYVLRRLNHALLHLPNPERVRVIYYNPLHLEAFRRDPAWKVKRTRAPRFRSAAIISRRRD